jgi:biopolymer transport protein ExbD
VTKPTFARHGMTASTRRIAIEPALEVEPQINVTPLIDVVLVLLIVFMVMTPLVEQELSVQLPVEKHTKDISQVAPGQVAIKVDAAGALEINSQPVSRSEYVEHVRRLIDLRSSEDQVIFIIASDATSYRSLIEAIDGAKRAGAPSVGFALDQVP